MAPDGVMLSNGPGNPEVVECANDSRNFRENSVLWYLSRTSTFALSQGASSFKMKFGHRGANHPVKI